MKTRSKRLLSMGLAAILAVSVLAGCGSKTESTDNSEVAKEAVEAGAEETTGGTVDFGALSEEDLQAIYEKEPASQRTIHISYDGGLCPAALPIAQLEGFFEEEGLDTDLVAVTEQRDALASGQIDTALGMLTDWLTSIQNGVDLRFSLPLHTGCTSAAVLADSDIEAFEAGQNVGVVGAIGGVYHNIALRFVAHDGFTADDFSWLSLDSGTILASLQQGESDVIVASDQLIQQWVDDGLVKRIRSQNDEDFKDEACCALGFPGEFVDENPATVYKITRAVYNASLWIEESDENKSTAVDDLLAEGYVSGEHDFNVNLLKEWRFGLTNADLERSLSDIVDEFVQLGILEEGIDKDAFKEQILIKYDQGALSKTTTEE